MKSTKAKRVLSMLMMVLVVVSSFTVCAFADGSAPDEEGMATGTYLVIGIIMIAVGIGLYFAMPMLAKKSKANKKGGKKK